MDALGAEYVGRLPSFDGRSPANVYNNSDGLDRSLFTNII
jgi:hypothetical protein